MRSRRWFHLLLVCATAAVLSVLAIGHLRFHSASSRLPISGRSVEHVAGLVDEVEVLFDGRGVPYVRANNQLDLWYTQGYLHARERFFDMELARRVSSGRLAELLGEQAVATDRRTRTCQLPAAAKRQAALLSVAELEVVDAYTAGVNAALERFGRWIAPEIWLLQADPEPWTAQDTLSVGVFLQFHISWAMGDEIDRAIQLGHLGPERAIDLWGWTDEQRREWIPPLTGSTAPLSDEDAINPHWDGAGSNAWALAGDKTASQRPILASDPHLGIVPARAWYVISLECPGFKVTGASVPGAPGVHIGHNEHVAWGFTMLLLDDQDLFTVMLDETGTMELIDGSWQPLRTVKEEIKVRFREEPELLKVQLSQRGPIVRSRNRETLALSWTGQQGPSQLGTFLRMDGAQSVQELAEAWEGIPGPAMNLIAAGVDGQIMHQVVGLVPIRGRGAGRLPAPGDDSRWAWRGLRPLSSNPRTISIQGFIANSNHDLFDQGDYSPREWQWFPTDAYAPWRVKRVRKELARRDDWDVGDTLELQGDITAMRAIEVLRQIWQDLEEQGGRTAQSLMSWDGRMTTDSIAPHLYSRLMLELAEEIAGDEARQAGLPPLYFKPEMAPFIGDPLKAEQSLSPFDPPQVLRILAGGMDPTWWDDVETPEIEDREAIITRVLDRLDAAQPRATWGRVHTSHFIHPLAPAPLLGKLIDRAWSRGPYPSPGSGQTINAYYSSDAFPFKVTAIPSLRFIADVGDWDRSIMVLAVGQSGRPWSPHYDDQLDEWLTVRPLPLPFSRGAIEEAAHARLQLIPATDRGSGTNDDGS